MTAPPTSISGRPALRQPAAPRQPFLAGLGQNPPRRAAELKGWAQPEDRSRNRVRDGFDARRGDARRAAAILPAAPADRQELRRRAPRADRRRRPRHPPGRWAKASTSASRMSPPSPRWRSKPSASARIRAPPTRSKRYQRWRRFDTALMVAVTDGMVRLFSNDVAPVRAIRDFGMGMVDRMPPVKDFLISRASGLDRNGPKLLRGLPI